MENVQSEDTKIIQRTKIIKSKNNIQRYITRERNDIHMQINNLKVTRDHIIFVLVLKLVRHYLLSMHHIIIVLYI